MKIPIRFVVWIWDRGVDDFATYAVPSILQDGNLPWLVRNGYAIALDFYTLRRDAARVERLAGNIQTYLAAFGPSTPITATLYAMNEDDRSPFEIKTTFFQVVVKRAVETSSHVIFLFADIFFGNGSIRNIVTYGQKPHVSVSGMYLRVKRDAFSALLEQHRLRTGSSTVSNARLVDMSMDCLIDGMKASIVDTDRNASFTTSGALRAIDDDLFTYTFHAPTPVLFTFEEPDLEFFTRFLWNFYLLDHLWPTMLIAQNRWRVMASSDLFFAAELNAAQLESNLHQFATRDGMLYNDEYDQEHLHGRIHQTMLMTLRRERLP